MVTACLLIASPAACGGSEAADLPPGPARSGLELFEMKTLRDNPGCVTCHSRDPETSVVGPSLAGVAVMAADRISGVTAGAYLRSSITDPRAYVVDGYSDQMPDDWASVLSAVEIDALVSYLLTLES